MKTVRSMLDIQDGPTLYVEVESAAGPLTATFVSIWSSGHGKLIGSRVER